MARKLRNEKARKKTPTVLGRKRRPTMGKAQSEVLELRILGKDPNEALEVLMLRKDPNEAIVPQEGVYRELNPMNKERNGKRQAEQGQLPSQQ
jgi:hypothetical protein